MLLLVACILIADPALFSLFIRYLTLERLSKIFDSFRIGVFKLGK